MLLILSLLLAACCVCASKSRDGRIPSFLKAFSVEKRGSDMLQVPASLSGIALGNTIDYLVTDALFFAFKHDRIRWGVCREDLIGRLNDGIADLQLVAINYARDNSDGFFGFLNSLYSNEKDPKLIEIEKAIKNIEGWISFIEKADDR
jgi:hypothetical protein